MGGCLSSLPWISAVLAARGVPRCWPPSEARLGDWPYCVDLS